MSGTYGGRGNSIAGGCIYCGHPVLYFNDPEPICPPCRVGRLLPAPTMPPYKPWYETMTPEELERIRTKPFSGGRTTWDEAPIPFLHPEGVHLQVVYQAIGGEGAFTHYQGKLIPADGGWVGYLIFNGYELNRRLSDCPCPVDTVVADFLLAQEATWFYGYDQRAHRLWKIHVGQLEEGTAIARDKVSTRQDYHPERLLWESDTDVYEKPRTKDKVLVKGREGRTPLLTTPLIPPSRTLTLRHIPKY